MWAPNISMQEETKKQKWKKIETIYLSFFNRTVTRTTSIALRLKPERGNIQFGVHSIYYMADTPAPYLLGCLTSIKRTEMYHMAFHHFICYKGMYKSFCVVDSSFIYDPHAKWIDSDSGSSLLFMELMRAHFLNPSLSISSHLKFQIIYQMIFRRQLCLWSFDAYACVNGWQRRGWLRECMTKMRINGLFALSVKFILGHMLWKCVPEPWPRPIRVRLRTQSVSLHLSFSCTENNNSRLYDHTDSFMHPNNDLNSSSVCYLWVRVMNWICSFENKHIM